MSLRNDLEQELKRLIGTHSPTSVTVSDAGGLQLRIDFTAVDSMSCSFDQIELFVPSLQNAAFDALKKWAENLSQRIKYLLENIGPLEYDPSGGQVLIRSTPPDQLPDGTQYYEIVLSSQSGGNFSLRRYQSVKGQPGRNPVEITVTHEVLLKLADDLVDTVP
ncbi:hypothetical protein Mal4_28320 [Maioricimonas rarisocia]|uniref:Uncharacterized protein n=1 Tax=Maioricimonas rarisocia TaxID=2528026 RepID=A0A517Z7S2_9PLAN|nr:hypothetical protein [Maioricimonas rarisocia]QDU38504.1 hypothetical protein Mal4_28320 [Maioricimonas rarisocia]